MGHEAPLDDRLSDLHVSPAERALYVQLRAQEARMVNWQCVTLAKLAVDSHASVRTWRRGANVFDIAMPPGTPIATFLDREGRDSTRYDAGIGVGAPGNMTTHAAVFIDHVPASAEGPAGILVFDQHAVIKRMRRMIYPADAGTFGTGNARNYHVINDEQGMPLGRMANPLWRRLVSDDAARDYLERHSDTAGVAA